MKSVDWFFNFLREFGLKIVFPTLIIIICGAISKSIVLKMNPHNEKMWMIVLFSQMILGIGILYYFINDVKNDLKEEDAEDNS